MSEEVDILLQGLGEDAQLGRPWPVGRQCGTRAGNVRCEFEHQARLRLRLEEVRVCQCLLESVRIGGPQAVMDKLIDLAVRGPPLLEVRPTRHGAEVVEQRLVSYRAHLPGQEEPLHHLADLAVEEVNEHCVTRLASCQVWIEVQIEP
ncbi:MAG TPA: hypothetical protein DGT21_09820 [Armatimonadetes bacterium]|nr:hypothetical protein [Armatimonadota bacterium]